MFEYLDGPKSEERMLLLTVMEKSSVYGEGKITPVKTWINLSSEKMPWGLAVYVVYFPVVSTCFKKLLGLSLPLHWRRKAMALWIIES